MKYHLFLLFLLIFAISCSDEKQDQVKSFEIDGQTEDGFESGVYCADISYYNPKTGTIGNYTLKVEVDDNKVEKILFSNGGWLDSDHMTPEELDDDGECKIVSFDGREYGIKIKDTNCSDYSAVSVDEQEPAMTFIDCATMLGMSQDEIEDYKITFTKDNKEVYTPERCNLLRDYIEKMRNLKAEKEAFDKMLDEGFIHMVFSRSNGNYIRCQSVIVKKYGTFFWLEVLNNEKCTMGTMQFDHTVNDWQDVTVKETPDSETAKRYRMKIVMLDSSKEKLEKLIENSCGVD